MLHSKPREWGGGNGGLMEGRGSGLRVCTALHCAALRCTAKN